MTRTISRITSLALAITAVAVPAASADPYGPDRDFEQGQVAQVSKVTPDARDAARPAPAIDRVSPDARDGGRREPAPIVVSQPPAMATDGFDWADAGLGAGGLAALLVLCGGTAVTVRTRRGAVRAS